MSMEMNMTSAATNFNLNAMTSPLTRQDAMLVAREIINCLDLIEARIDAAIAHCEATTQLERLAA